MKKISEIPIEESSGSKLSCKRAKTAFQLKRNSSLFKASDALKKDNRCKNKSIQINWKMDGSKDRSVQVDGNIVFRQSPNDIAGKFAAPFEQMSF